MIANTEVLEIAESVSRDKGINKELIINAIEEAIKAAAYKKYGNTHLIKAEINRKNGDIKIYRLREIVEEVNDYANQISLQDALEKDPEAVVGNHVSEQLPSIDLGRVAAQSARKIIVDKVKEAEYEKQYNDFKDRVGEILTGVVKSFEKKNIIVDIGRTEAILRIEDQIHNEAYRSGDKIKCFVKEVRPNPFGPQIMLSRIHPGFLVKLMEQEVPEIYDKFIEVKSVARDPGSKAKVAVFASDISIDAVGCCVGIRGSRIKNVTNELFGEKIDVIPWHKDLSQFVINALSPGVVSKVLINEKRHRIEVIVETENLSLTLGKRGQNVRLASKLVGWGIDVLTEEQESKRRIEEFNATTALFMRVLDVEEVIAQLLAVEGYNSIEQLCIAQTDDLMKIEGFDADIAEEIKSRANNFIEKRNYRTLAKLENLGVTQDIIDIFDIDLNIILKLAENGIKSVEDLLETTADEIVQYSLGRINKDQAEKFISEAKSK